MMQLAKNVLLCYIPPNLCSLSRYHHLILQHSSLSPYYFKNFVYTIIRHHSH